MPASTKDGAAGKDLEAQCCWLPACSVLGRGDGPSRMGLANHRPQHGLIDYESAVGMLQAISTTRTVPLVRVPWTDPGIVMKVLDADAYGVICPMINSAAEARIRCGLSLPARGHTKLWPDSRKHLWRSGLHRQCKSNDRHHGND